MAEFDRKQNKINELLAEKNLDALLLQKVSSFAWATCGASSAINIASTDGTAAILITPSHRYLITTNIETPRLEKEVKLKEQGWEFYETSWYAPSSPVAELAGGLRLGADGLFPGAVDLSADVARLRLNLGEEECERFRALGRLCASAMDSAIRQVQPGQSEYQIAALLAYESERRGVQAIVNLIASDERIFAYRHPLPTDKIMQRYAMLVLCGRRWGLVCSLTRLVHFGRLPADVQSKAAALSQIDATMIAATRPGASVGAVFQRCQQAYAAAGYPDEWQLHLQGGPAGYEPREYLATAETPDIVATGQTYAWNPSITGTKSEDTILVGPTGNEILTAIDGWPSIPAAVDGQQIDRPAILSIE